MARLHNTNQQKEHVTKDLLLEILAAGASLIVEVHDAFTIKVRHPMSRMPGPWESYYPSSLNRQLTRLWRRGFVDVKETSHGYTVLITDRGKTESLRYDVRSMEIPSQQTWDHKWRMVIFDIPSDKDTIRREFQHHLADLGFYQMQKSVYVYPFPCDKQVKFLREVYGIPHAVKLATISHLENDEDLQRIFHIQG